MASSYSPLVAKAPAIFVMFWRKKRIKVKLSLAKDVLSRYFFDLLVAF